MPKLQTVVATCGNGAQGRLGHGAKCLSSQFMRIVGSLVGHEIKEVAAGGAHTAVVTGAPQRPLFTIDSAVHHGSRRSVSRIQLSVVLTSYVGARRSWPRRRATRPALRSRGAEDGSLFTFGMNDKGQLGHSDKDKFVPVSHWQGMHVCGLAAAHAAQPSPPAKSQAHDFTTLRRPTQVPLEVGLPDPVELVAVGDHHTVCLTRERAGTPWNALPCAATHSPHRLALGLRVAHTRAAGAGAGEVWAWGSHEAGQLGIGPTPEYTHRTPRLVKALTGAAGSLLCCRGR